MAWYDGRWLQEGSLAHIRKFGNDDSNDWPESTQMRQSPYMQRTRCTYARLFTLKSFLNMTCYMFISAQKTYKYFSVIWLLCNCGYEMIICETFLEFSMFTSVGRTATHLMKYSDQNNKTSEQLTQSVCCCHVIVRGHHPCILVQ